MAAPASRGLGAKTPWRAATGFFCASELASVRHPCGAPCDSSAFISRIALGDQVLYQSNAPDGGAHHRVDLDPATLADLGVVNGRAPGQFAPDQPVLRKEFAKLLALAYGLTAKAGEPSPFVDAPGDVR